jgi:hypothetical protein
LDWIRGFALGLASLLTLPAVPVWLLWSHLCDARFSSRRVYTLNGKQAGRVFQLTVLARHSTNEDWLST